MKGKKKPEHLKRVLIGRFVKQIGMGRRRTDIKIKWVSSLGEIAGKEATSSKSSQVVGLHATFNDGHVDDRTICLRYGSDKPLLRLRPELTLADAMGVTRIMGALRERLKARYGSDALRVPSPSHHWIVLKSGKLHKLPQPEEWDCTASIRPFVLDLNSYLSCLKKRQSNTEPEATDATTMQALAELLSIIHVKPNVEDVERKPPYRECVSYILSRIGGWHNLSLGAHSILAPAEARGLHSLICDTLHENTGTSDRLREVWGDMHFGNLLCDNNRRFIPIDPRVRGGFPQVGDAGLDVGFLLTDLWWFYRVFDNSVFRYLAHLLLEAYEKATGDTKIRFMAAQWGVPYRTAMRLKSEYVKEGELAKARPFIQDMQTWMSNRCVDVTL